MDPRFERQVRYEPFGRAGQARLLESRVLLVGCGATGGVLAQTLTRAGVGTLVLVDRDVVDESNLGRQVLFEPHHAEAGATKVAAAAETLARMGGPTRVETHAVHLDARNAAALARDCQLVLDGTDNSSTRYLLNDLCVEHGLPWIYGGVVGSEGRVLLVLPGVGPCLRCLFPDPPPPGALATCDTSGVLLPAVAAVAAFQAGLALRVLARGADDPGLSTAMLAIDVWHGTARRVQLTRQQACPCCGDGERAFLFGHSAEFEVLCGRGAVQVLSRSGAPDLAAVAERLLRLELSPRRVGDGLRFGVENLRVTVFADGRALVEGTDEPARARGIVDRYVGG